MGRKPNKLEKTKRMNTYEISFYWSDRKSKRIDRVDSNTPEEAIQAFREKFGDLDIFLITKLKVN